MEKESHIGGLSVGDHVNLAHRQGGEYNKLTGIDKVNTGGHNRSLEGVDFTPHQ